MADIIGVLGENDDVTVGTHTVYTCPAGKMARGQIMYRGQATASAPGLSIRVNGVEIFTQASITGSNYVWSTNDLLYNTNAAAPTGASIAQTVAKYDQDYYLSAGDTVQYIIASNDFATLDVMFVGAELDAS